MTSLGTEYPKEQARCRELLKAYQEIGPAGTFAKVMIEQVLQEADKAAIGGDVTEMLRSYNAMQECN